MHISTNLYDSIKSVFLKDSRFELFNDYCYNLSIGLRKNGLKSLNIFIDNTDNWIFEDKREFCELLFSIFDKYPYEAEELITYDLRNRLIKPTFLKWIDCDSDNVNLLKWFGYYFDKLDLLKKAYALNKQDNLLNEFLFVKLVNSIWISAHHLPNTYLGIIDEDIQNINLAKELSLLCMGFKDLNLYKQNLIDYEKMILEYVKINNK